LVQKVSGRDRHTDLIKPFSVKKLRLKTYLTTAELKEKDRCNEIAYIVQYTLDGLQPSTIIK
jgi:hypothetical protein